MTKLIAITGTHGTGKTTLSFQLAAEYKRLGANVKVIQEVARICPFPLNENMTSETALWIYHEHSKKELEACRDHDVVICDRTRFDSFVYAESLNIRDLKCITEFVSHELNDYDLLYFVRHSEDELPKNDGIRSTDIEFQEKVDRIFYKYLSNVPHKQIESCDIFKEGKSWNTFYQ